MIKVNLLPVREWRRKEAVRQQITIFFLLFFLLLSILLAVGITVQAKLAFKRDDLAQLEARKNKLSPVNEKIAQINKRREEIERRFSSIERLQQGRDYAVRAIDEVVTAMPIDRTWLSRLQLSDYTIEISGTALDNHTVALFMKRLQGSPMVNEVILNSTRKKNFQGKELMGFALTLRLKNVRGPSDEQGSHK